MDEIEAELRQCLEGLERDLEDVEAERLHLLHQRAQAEARLKAYTQEDRQAILPW